MAVYVKDRQFRFVTVNQRFAEELRRTPADLVGKTDFDLTSGVFAERVRADDERIMASGVMEEFDQTYFRDGQNRILRTTKVPMRNAGGEVTGVLGMFCDITEQRHLEASHARQKEFVDAILAALPGILCLVDEEGHTIHWNSQAEELTGYTAEEIARTNVMDFYQGEDREKVLDALQQVLTTGHATVEANLTTKDRGELPLYHVGQRVTIAGRTYVLGFSLDVTEKRRTEEALRRKDAELEEQQRLAFSRLQLLSRRLLEIQEAERRSLARELHDELGQALTATKITLQTLERYPDPNSLAARLADARTIVDRALDQVRSLSLGLRPPLLDDLGLAAALRWLLDQHGRRTGVRVHFFDDAGNQRVDASIETASFRIAQEALTNATKHSWASTVHVELHRRDGWLHLHVRDNGLGFDVSGARERAASGASLGLMSMEERATLAGGHIEWTSGSGLGTHVHAWFPVGGRQ
jgi:PAS domain S-box-containing protein